MRQVFALAQMITLCLCLTLLCACARGETTLPQEKIRSEFAEAQQVEMTLKLTADYGTRVYEYTVSYTGSGDIGTLEILQPESIAGLRAELREGSAYLVYDGTEFETGAILPDGVSPVDALPMLITQWQTGYVTDAVSESYKGLDTVALTTAVSDAVSLRTWFDGETLLPVHAEISYNNSVVLFCDFEDVVLHRENAG